MASGVNHNKGTVFITLPTSIAALTFGAGFTGMLACGLGCLTNILINPDLDIPNRTRSEYLMYRYLGKILGGVWFAFWWPYGKLISHRSPLSHMPVLGTALRIVYMYLWGGLITWSVTGLLGSPIGFLPLSTFNTPLFWWWSLGLAAADALHYIMDIVPFFRQGKRARRRKRWGKILVRALTEAAENSRKRKESEEKEAVKTAAFRDEQSTP